MATLRVHMIDADGKPFAESYLRSLYHADLHFEPARRQSVITPDGVVELEITGSRRVLHARLRVPEFGTIWVMADKCGEGYSADDSDVDFVREAAASMLLHAWQVMDYGACSPECAGHIDAADEYLRLAVNTAGQRRCSAHSTPSGLVNSCSRAGSCPHQAAA